jgi:hypothetical protein
MRQIILIFIFLILLSIVALAYQGINFAGGEKIIDIGPIQATQKTNTTIPLPFILNGLAFAGGIALVIIGAKE